MTDDSFPCGTPMKQLSLSNTKLQKALLTIWINGNFLLCNNNLSKKGDMVPVFYGKA